MADFNKESQNPAISFVDFPEDVLLTILSFLSPSEISSFCVTSKRFVPLGRNDSKLWFCLCDRRWGSKTHIRSWSHNGQIPFHLLYKTLDRLDNLIGFWRRIDRHVKPSVTADTNPPSLVFFEWGPSFITGSEIRHHSCYDILKKPFLWMGVSPCGEPVNYLHPPVTNPVGSKGGSDLGLVEFGCLDDLDLVSVNVGFVGKNHFVVEENQSFVRRNLSPGDFRADELGCLENSAATGSSPPEQVTSDIYRYFANRTSPGWERACRRQRRKERLRQGKRLWEPQHFVKIVNDSPTSSRPLQGLWKGLDIHQDLCFYIVAYDDIGGIACRRVGESKGDFSGYSPVFWTSNTTFVEPPFSREERVLYSSRQPAKPFRGLYREKGELSRIVHINSSYDLVLPDLADSFTSSTSEGRIWQYKDGTFAFGFLRDHFNIDLWHVALNGRLLDIE